MYYYILGQMFVLYVFLNETLLYAIVPQFSTLTSARNRKIERELVLFAYNTTTGRSKSLRYVVITE